MSEPKLSPAQKILADTADNYLESRKHAIHHDREGEGLEFCKDGKYRLYPVMFSVRVTRSRMQSIDQLKSLLEVAVGRRLERTQIFDHLFKLIETHGLLEPLVHSLKLGPRRW